MSTLEFLNIEFSDTEIFSIRERWRGLGFLEKSTNERNHSLAFELLCKRLLEPEKEHPEELNTVLFPVTYRIIKQYEDNLPLDTLKVFVLELIDTFPINKLKTHIENHNHRKDIDAEAQFLSDYCENYPPITLR